MGHLDGFFESFPPGGSIGLREDGGDRHEIGKQHDASDGHQEFRRNVEIPDSLSCAGGPAIPESGETGAANHGILLGEAAKPVVV